MKTLKTAILLIVLFVSACTGHAGWMRHSSTLPEKNKQVNLNEILIICQANGWTDLLQRIKASPPPKPFESDGCSMFFDTIEGINLYPACFRHDLEYWVGGSETDRLIADAQLMIDVAKLGNPILAEIMFRAVRLGGTDKLKTPFHWGFGQKD